MVFLQDRGCSFGRDVGKVRDLLCDRTEILFREILVDRAGRFITQDDQEDGCFAHSSPSWGLGAHSSSCVPCRTQVCTRREAPSGSFFTLATRCLFKTTVRITSEFVSDKSFWSSCSISAKLTGLERAFFPSPGPRPACSLRAGKAFRVATTCFLTGRRIRK